MKRIVVLQIIFTALVVFALSGCGAKDVKESVGSVEESMTEESIAEEIEDKNTGTNDIYEAFIDGEVKVKYEKATNINNGDVLGDYLEEGKEYTIDEIGWYPKEKVTLEGEELEQFKMALDKFENIDDITNIYHNVDLGE